MLENWLAWHHLIFLLPLTVAVVMVLLAGLSDLHLGHPEADVAHGGLHAEGDLEAHADLHAETGLHADTDIDAHAGLHPEAAGEVHGEAHTDHGHGDLWGLAGFFGVGRVPLSLLLQTMAFLWGFVGLLLIQFTPPAVAIVGAAFTTLFGTRALALVMGRLLGGPQATRRSQFVGKVGEVVFEVTPRFGVVHVRDERGTVYRLNARAQADALAPGQRIVVVGYDPQENLYEVADPVRFLQSGGK